MDTSVAIVVLLVLMGFSDYSVVYAGTYANNVIELLETLLGTIDNTCRKDASAKSSSPKFSGYNDDKKMAVELVNIYTQECSAYIDNANKKPFYATLNAGLRNGNSTPVWNRSKELLMDGLTLLGIEPFPKVFRACHCNDIREGTPFSFRQFASTTTSATVAYDFLESGKAFIQIVNVDGTDIEPYSSFPEKEILLQPDRQLHVERVLTDKTLVKEELEKLLPDSREASMFVLLDGDMSTARRKRSGEFESTCDCVNPYNTISSSASTPKHTMFRVWFVAIVFGLHTM